MLNKRDRLEDGGAAARAEHPDAILLSARDPDDVAMLRQRIIDFFEREMTDDELVLPYGKQGLVADVYEHVRVLEETFDEAGRRLKVRALPGTIERLRRALR